MSVGHLGDVPIGRPQFRPFTRESLAAIEARMAEKKAVGVKKRGEEGYVYHQQREPNKDLEAGQQLPRPLERNFPPELIATPIEDLDPFYEDEPTFVVVSKGHDIFRFSATKSLYMLDPFHPVRRVAIYMLVHPLFSFLVITTILVNCVIMTQPPNEAIEQTEIIFTTIYTFESCLKVTARGFIKTQFTYLRDPWNWLDFVVIALAYMTMFIKELGNLSALRTFRVLRALKTVAIIPGMKTIVGAVIESVKNLRDVIILTCFSLSVFALLGLQIYMGVLTQKCIKLSDDHEMNDSYWFDWHNNTDHWYRKVGAWDYYLCGNSSGAQSCPEGYMCLQGFGKNPNYDYTNFDSFGWSLLSAFRLMTQDAWEMLYQQVLRVTGPYHIMFFIVAIFLGSIYLVNLILAIVAMSYDELQKKSEEDAEAKAAEEAAYQESQRQIEEDEQTARQERFAARERATHHAAVAAGATIHHNSLTNSTSLITQHPHQHHNQIVTATNHNYNNNNNNQPPNNSNNPFLQNNQQQQQPPSAPASDHNIITTMTTDVPTPAGEVTSTTTDQQIVNLDQMNSDVNNQINNSKNNSAKNRKYKKGIKGGYNFGCNAFRRKGSGKDGTTTGGGVDSNPETEGDEDENNRLVIQLFMEAQENFPYVDESVTRTPMSEDENDEHSSTGILGTNNNSNSNNSLHSRQPSYTSHSSRVSYTSHAGAILPDGSMMVTTPGSVINTHHMIQTPDTPNTQMINNSFINPTGQFMTQQPSQTSNPLIQPHMEALQQMPAPLHHVLHHPLDVFDSKSGGGDVMSRDESKSRQRLLSQVTPVYHQNSWPNKLSFDNRYGLDDSLDSEPEKIPLRDKVISACLRCLDIFCVWNCCWCWEQIQKMFATIVFDPFMELFITLCIVVNTLFMAMDHHDMDPDFEKVLKAGNYFFTATFAIEAFLKLLALSPKFYFREGWNIFDFVIVFLSLLELGLENVSGLSVLRSFRLLRVFKLAKSWPTLNLLISIMGKTVGDLGNLTFVLAIIIFIFAVMGMQLFGKHYEENVDRFFDQSMPRWNFTDFMHSFMIVFRVLCGEWIESMWDCLLVAGPACVPFFLATVVIGNLVVLNLFLALLLSSFGASNLSAPSSDSADTKKLQEAFDRFSRAHKWVKSKALAVVKFFRCQKARNQISDRTADSPIEMDMGTGSNLVLDGDNLSKDQQEMMINRNAKENTELEVIVDDGMINNSNSTPVNKKKFKNSAQSVINTVKALKGMQTPLRNSENSLINKSGNNSSVENSPRLNKKLSSTHNLEASSKSSLAKSDLMVANNNLKSALSQDGSNESQVIDMQPSIGDGVVLEPNELMDADKVETATADIIVNEYPVDCFPEKWYEKCPWCLEEETPYAAKWKELRYNSYNLVENKYFETVCITLILISSLTLALEDVHLKNRKWLQDSLTYVDKFFTVIFLLEMLLKWVAYGFKAYFSNAWCWLDFVIVMVSIFNLAVGLAGFGNIPAFKTMRTLRALRPLRAMSRLEGMRVSVVNLIATWAGMGKIQAFKTMRTLRALRPLRAMSRMQGMRVVVNALVQAIPAIANVLLVCLIFWLIFAIMGVQMFAGKFFSCNMITEAGLERVPFEVVTNAEECKRLNDSYTWSNPQVNFDNVLNGYLCLFQVATFKGWIDIMNNAIDSKQIGEQPEDEVNIYMYLYFVFFIIFGSFFTLNLFIGVIIDNFNEQKKKSGGSLEMFMTEDQKKYYNAMKKMGSKKPAKAIPRPRFKLQAIVFDITTNKKFDMVIMLFIGLNMLIMALDSYQPPELQSIILDRLNLFFIAVFAAECFLKIFALRIHYFKEPWNMFDFVVVMLSIAGVMLKDLIATYFVSPTLLRVVRVVKVGRVLRLVKGARGIRTLLFALAMSLPALFNICLLLFLVMFIYAIFGMSFFMNVKQRYGIDETFNFGTFFKSFILLFQMCTSAGWAEVLAAIMDDTDCSPGGTEDDGGSESDCGSRGIAIAYLISYLVISFLVILNMYIAVILENYSQATEDVEQGLTDDDYDMYYEIWQKFDPKGTQFIPYSVLSDFLDALEEPLQIPKPNKFKLVQMDIPICINDMCYCVEILDALTKNFFASKGAAIEETQELAEIAPLKGEFEHISSTMWRQREHYAARIIQNAFRQFKSSGGSSNKRHNTIGSNGTLANQQPINNNTQENTTPTHNLNDDTDNTDTAQLQQPTA